MRLMTLTRFSLLTILALLMLAVNPQANATDTGVRASEFKLSNGMDVVVIPDHRAPVVTHMVWYRVGAADEKRGSSGIAHFLEHLMFKSTDKIPVGEFSKIVGRLGGQDNAFTGQDATAYFQRVAKDRLGTMMEMEADRMVNLRLDEKEVLTERDVILEERRSRIDNNPAALLERADERRAVSQRSLRRAGHRLVPRDAEALAPGRVDILQALLRTEQRHPRRFGRCHDDEVKKLAEATYGKIPANPDISPVRHRPDRSAAIAPRRLELKDPRAGNFSLQRYYIVPSYVTAKPGEAEALDLLMKIAGSGSTSRLYKKLVVASKLASSAGGDYSGYGLDGGNISLYAVAADGVPLAKVEAAIDEVLADIAKNGVTDAELARAKSSYLADYIYDSDNQATLARRYGWSLAVGRTVADVEAWPDAISKVTADDVKKVAAQYFDLRLSVTGYLVPDQTGVAQSDEDLPPPSSDSELR